MADQKNLISNYFRDRSIFITGATGFLGKVLVEKLLRSCPDIKTIYVLLRPKKGCDIQQRIEDLLKVKLFEKVKKKYPDLISKLVAINGDITCEGLGISTSDVNLLVENVSVIFHSAANVKFDGTLKSSVNINVLGTRRLLELCHKMKKLEALIHVSTAYSQCDRSVIEEKIYDFPLPPQKLLETLEWMDDDLVAALTPHLIRNRPNIYSYTKALTESLLAIEGSALPIAVVRPSIVTASWKEPFPGWVDNYNGPTSVITGIGKGLMRTLYCKKSCSADLIPVDVVVNQIIAAACYTAIHKPQDIKVYNSTSGSINRLTWGEVEKLVYLLTVRHPSDELFRYPGGSFKGCKYWNNISIIFCHHIPAYFFDLILVLTGGKSQLIPLYKKVHRAMNLLEYFTTREWIFNCDNILMLQDTFSAEDKKEFNFNIESLDWKAYMEDYILGIRYFLLKNDASSLPLARKKLKRMYLYTMMIYIFIFVAIVWIIITWLF